MRCALALIAATALFAACRDDGSGKVDDTLSADTAADTVADDTTADTALDTTDTVPPVASNQWCERLRGGQGTTQPAALAVSHRHRTARFFGPGASYLSADAALADALEPVAALTDGQFAARYAARLESVCVANTAPETLGRAEVTMADDIAWVKPGNGNGTGAIPAEPLAWSSTSATFPMTGC
jgi:hypothetical protein